MKLLTFIMLIAMLGLSGCISNQRHKSLGSASAPADNKNGIRIGVYDSRAVAVAYCDSELHKAEDGRLMRALDTAKKSGDADRIHQADRALWEWRKRLHRQAFSTYPVDDILNQMQKELDPIRQELGLDTLVSKWDAEKLLRYNSADQVDVTERIVRALTSNERRQRMAMSIVKKKPIPPLRYESLLKKEAGEHY